MIKNTITAILFSAVLFLLYSMYKVNDLQYTRSKEIMQYIQQHPNDNKYLFTNFNAIKQYTETKKGIKYKITIYEEYQRKYFLIDKENEETGEHIPVEVIEQSSQEGQNISKLLNLYQN